MTLAVRRAAAPERRCLRCACQASSSVTEVARASSAKTSHARAKPNASAAMSVTVSTTTFGGSAALCGVDRPPSSPWLTMRITWLPAAAPGLTSQSFFFCDAVPSTAWSRTAERIFAKRLFAVPLPSKASIVACLCSCLWLRPPPRRTRPLRESACCKGALASGSAVTLILPATPAPRSAPPGQLEPKPVADSPAVNQNRSALRTEPTSLLLRGGGATAGPSRASAAVQPVRAPRFSTSCLMISPPERSWRRRPRGRRCTPADDAPRPRRCARARRPSRARPRPPALAPRARGRPAPAAARVSPEFGGARLVALGVLRRLASWDTASWKRPPPARYVTHGFFERARFSQLL